MVNLGNLCHHKKQEQGKKRDAVSAKLY